MILGAHVTDDLRDFGIEYEPTDDKLERRAISWRYQHDLVAATPKPRLWLPVMLRDFVLQQDATIGKLEQYLGMKLEKIPVIPEAIGRWKKRDDIDFSKYEDILSP